MRDPSTLAGLLATLLDLPESAAQDRATPSFRSWLDAGRDGRWPPTGRGGLWLVDTRDGDARRGAVTWSAPDAPWDAALVLGGRGLPGSPLRRTLRRIRRPGTRRWSPERIASLLRALPSGVEVTTLGFPDGPEVPTSFTSGEDARRATGTAFLLTRGPAFSGGVWTFVGEALGGGEPQVRELHLRERGAAVTVVETPGGRRVVRVVPDERLQEVVLRNHRTLCALREAMAGDPGFLALTPEPLFAERHAAGLVLAESRLSGIPAWKLDSGRFGAVVHDGALKFLDKLRRVSGTPPELPEEVAAALFAADRRRLDDAGFVDEDVGLLLAGELEQGGRSLAAAGLPTHATHGDFGYGNVLADERTGRVTGVIDWDTARLQDLPGIDRVNLEIQIDPGAFATSVRRVWAERRAHDALTPGHERALFGVAVCRYVLRSLTYPEVYRAHAAQFREALAWLARTPS